MTKIVITNNKTEGELMKNYIIVYQMGKVASTSIVASLNDFDDIEAVQSHFLGEDALRAVLPSIIGADVPQYFFKHQLGQFVENTIITRRMNQILANRSNGDKLVVISLARDPIEWVRSGIVQDAAGYLPIFQAICENKGLPCSSDVDAVENGLDFILKSTCDLLEAKGGIDLYLENTARDPNRFNGTIFKKNPGTARLFSMILRPVDWFEKHFEAALGVQVSEMTKTNDLLVLRRDNADYIIGRYEDMSSALTRWLRDEDICDISEFRRENTSGEKPFSKQISEVFKGDQGMRLQNLFQKTAYSQQFEYYGSENLAE